MELIEIANSAAFYGTPQVSNDVGKVLIFSNSSLLFFIRHWLHRLTLIIDHRSMMIIKQRKKDIDFFNTQFVARNYILSQAKIYIIDAMKSARVCLCTVMDSCISQAIPPDTAQLLRSYFLTFF